jgi:hypothetical protein
MSHLNGTTLGSSCILSPAGQVVGTCVRHGHYLCYVNGTIIAL